MKSDPEKAKRIMIGNLNPPSVELDDRFLAPTRQVAPPTFSGRIISSSRKTGELTSHGTAVETLKNHMLDIADNPAGSNPEKYLSPQEVEVLRDFRQVFNALGWPNSNEIVMRQPNAHINLGRLGIHHTWKMKPWKVPGTHIDLRSKLKESFYPKKSPVYKGYVIGTLSVRLAGNHVPIAYCSDGLLRSLRGDELEYDQTAFGWGKLPDPEILKPAMGRGSHPYGVDTGALPLEERLGERIKGSL